MFEAPSRSPWIAALTVALLAVPLLPRTLLAQPVEEEIDRVVVVRTKLPDPHALTYFTQAGAYLGVTMLELTPELRLHFGGPEDQGVMISSVQPGSPAEEVGILVGDLLTTLDGRGIGSGHEVALGIHGRRAGESVTLGLLRDGSPVELTATLAERDKPTFDVSRAVGLPGGHFEYRFECESEEDCPEIVHLAPEAVDEAMGRLRVELQSPNIQQRILDFRDQNQELEDRIRELEVQLRELKQQLDELDR